MGKVQFSPVLFQQTGSINIDAEEIKKHKLVQEETEMVELHNGCICCTLRGDLLKGPFIKDVRKIFGIFDFPPMSAFWPDS